MCAFAVAICIKPYLVLLLISPLLERDFRHFARVVGAVASASLVGFLLLQGAWDTSIGMYLQTTGRYSRPKWQASSLTGTHGMLGVLTHPVLLGTGDPLLTLTWIKAFPTWALLAPGTAWLALVAWVLYKKSLSPPLRFALLMSLGMLVVPSSQAYTAIFASCAGVVLVSSPVGPGVRRFRARMRSGSCFCQRRAGAVPIRCARDQHGSLLLSLGFSVAWLVAGIACATSRNERNEQGDGSVAPRRSSSSQESPPSRFGPESGSFKLRINRAVSAKISSFAPHSYPRDHQGMFLVALVSNFHELVGLYLAHNDTGAEFSLLIYPDLHAQWASIQRGVLLSIRTRSLFLSTGAHICDLWQCGRTALQICRHGLMSFLALGVWNLTRHLGRLPATNRWSFDWLPLRWFDAHSVCMASCVCACNVVAEPRNW